MPLTAPVISGAITAAGAGVFPGSQDLPKIAQAVGLSVPTWIRLPTNVLSLGVTTGIAGTGTVTGKAFFVPTGQVIAALNGAGLNGQAAQGIGAAVETGLTLALNTNAQYIGISIGVGVGADATKVSLSNPAPLIPILLSNLQAVGIAGQQGPQLASGLGTGIAGLVATGFGFGGVAGIAGGVPGAGTSVSTVF